MDFTARMLQMLAAVRRERNGAVADAMRYYGKPYGLNYGVSLPTLRSFAKAEGTDHAFARFLYEQDVRELRLAAYWIADPAMLDAAEAEFWGRGIFNSEMASEIAFALLGRTERIGKIFEAWTQEEQPVLRCYAALMGASRNPLLTADRLPAVARIVRDRPDDRLAAQGVVALLDALCNNKENRETVVRFLGSLDASPSADSIREEMAWRMTDQ